MGTAAGCAAEHPEGGRVHVHPELRDSAGDAYATERVREVVYLTMFWRAVFACAAVGADYVRTCCLDYMWNYARCFFLYTASCLPACMHACLPASKWKLSSSGRC